MISSGGIILQHVVSSRVGLLFRFLLVLLRAKLFLTLTRSRVRQTQHDLSRFLLFDLTRIQSFTMFISSSHLGYQLHCSSTSGRHDPRWKYLGDRYHHFRWWHAVDGGRERGDADVVGHVRYASAGRIRDWWKVSARDFGLVSDAKQGR